MPHAASNHVSFSFDAMESPSCFVKAISQAPIAINAADERNTNSIGMKMTSSAVVNFALFRVSLLLLAAI